MDPTEAVVLERYRRAVNYLAAAQIYLKDNPLLEEPLQPEHLKARLLGHWGTAPGINLIYAHLNRLIRKTGASILQPHNLRVIRALAERRPDLFQVACFDTAFHRTQPRPTRSFALPRPLTEAGLERYGFHGLSFEGAADFLSRQPGGTAGRRVVAAHLGAGVSLCALRDGKSIATTMGFSTLDGVPMATRCGTLDPGVVLHLLTERG